MLNVNVNMPNNSSVIINPETAFNRILSITFWNYLSFADTYLRVTTNITFSNMHACTDDAMMSTTYKRHESKNQPPDAQDVRVAVRVSAYTIIVFLVSAYFLLSIWPATTGELALNSTRAVTLLGIGITFSLGPETTLLFVIMLSGIIGACAFSFFAISYHLGAKNDFDKVWEAWYVLRPILGAGLALVIYLLLRGGVLTIGADLNSLNLVGVAGISGLAGMFSEQATRMLRNLADTAFGERAEPKPNDKKKVKPE